ncbi:MAG: hypothetical protein KJ964_01425 [Verrucomicrobia bacterium]|nr:hypothetical protein [Verrucomicrobiota bacterium]
MKKITLLALKAHQAETIVQLRSLGVLHIRYLMPSDTVELEEAREHLAHAHNALAVLPPPHDGVRPSGQTAEALMAAVWKLIHRRKALTDRREQLLLEEKKLEPFGEFEPAALQALKAHGIHVRLYFTLPKKNVPAPEGAVVRVLRRTRYGTWFAVISREAVPVAAEEQALPDTSIVRIQRELADGDRELVSIGKEFERLSGDRGRIAQQVNHLEEQVKFMEVQAGMGANGPVVYLQGFGPEFSVPTVHEAAQAHGWGLLIEDPAESDPVPTLIKSVWWARPIKAVFDLLGILPGYREMDVSIVFLVFSSVFFAMLVNDAGYGLLFLCLTVLMRWKWKAAPSNLLPLLGIMSVATMIWGVLTGSYFGIQNLPAPLKQWKIEWLGHEANLMNLCFFIGALHLTVAHTWNVIRQRHSLTAISQAGWIGLAWTMYFVACYFVIGRPMPGFVPWLFGISLVAMVLFMVPLRQLKKEWPNYCVLPFTVIGNFGDVVSYMRLYLVGSASAILILAFNELAVGDGIHSIWAGLAAALIIFAAHVLNISLCALAVLVHGVRLNALEFSSHLGIQWAGIKYAPFADSSTPRNAGQAINFVQRRAGH